MSLEIFKDIKEIGGFKVNYNENFVDADRPIGVDDSERPHTITFAIQTGPIKEEGVNGCQIDTVIETIKKIYEDFQDKYPCSETWEIIGHLESILDISEKRKRDREARGVEGRSKV